MDDTLFLLRANYKYFRLLVCIIKLNFVIVIGKKPLIMHE